MKKFFVTLFLIAGLLATTSCGGGDEPDPKPEGEIVVTPNHVDANYEANTFTAATVITNLNISDIVVTSAAAWCEAELATQQAESKAVDKTPKASNKYYLNLTLKKNSDFADRTVTINLKDKNSSALASLLLTQKGKPDVKVESDKLSFIPFAETLFNAVTTNVEASQLDVSSNASWATVTLQGAEKIKCSVVNNGTINTRTATVKIIVKDHPETEKSFTIEQKGLLDYMVLVEGGTFMMGATSEQGSDAFGWEKPAHSVTLDSYYIGRYEMTQKLWEAVMGNNPSKFKGENQPVENVSWTDCQTFINKINQITGKTFRIPTEAEWEFAARGGKKSKGYKYSGSNNVDEVAWYDGNRNINQEHEVGLKKPNELGIYDMSGNVEEWCYDWYAYYSSSAQTNPLGPMTGTKRVLRGGSWLGAATDCRVSYRTEATPSSPYHLYGFRIAIYK